MMRDLTMSAVIALLLLLWFIPHRPPLTVTVSPEIEAAAIRIIKEHVNGH